MALEFPKNINAKCTSFLGIIIADRKFDRLDCLVDGCMYHSYPQGNHQDICAYYITVARSEGERQVWPWM